GKGFDHLAACHSDRLGHAVDQVTAAHVDRKVLFALEQYCCSDLALYLLGCPVTDQEVEAVTHVADYLVVEGVAGDAQRVGDHDASKADDGDVGGAAADVDRHGADRLHYVDAGTD